MNKKRGILAALVLAGMMVMANPVGIDAGPNGEVGITENALIQNPGLLEELTEQGYTVLIRYNDGTRQRVAPGEIYVRHQPNFVPMAEAPGLSAKRESHKTNGDMHAAILGWVRENMTTKDMGPMAGRQMRHEDDPVAAQALSDDLMRRIQRAAATDPAYKAFGLNAAGRNMYHGSKSVILATGNGDVLGGFAYGDRNATIAINRLRNGVIRELPPEEIALTILYEIEGRGRGWAPVWNHAAAEHLGAISASQRGLSGDPSLERAASEAAGGIHLGFEAADRGQAAMRDFMNANIPRANPQFTFTYDQWQTARTVDRSARGVRTGVVAEAVLKANSGRGSVDTILRNGQLNIQRAIDPNRTAKQRESDGEAANEFVLMLAEVGKELNLAPTASVTDDRRPMIDINNPTGWIQYDRRRPESE
jgi:biotin-(acetyl-CoA carboxylase) ligase/phage tail protein X